MTTKYPKKLLSVEMVKQKENISIQLYKAFSLDNLFVLANQVWRYNCFHGKQLWRQTWMARITIGICCKVKPDWSDSTGKLRKSFIQSGAACKDLTGNVQRTQLIPPCTHACMKRHNTSYFLETIVLYRVQPLKPFLLCFYVRHDKPFMI